jgi:hypothetical protein
MSTTINQGIQLCEGILTVMGRSARIKVHGEDVKLSELRNDLLALAKSHGEMTAARAAYFDAAAAHRGLASKVGFEELRSALVVQLRATFSPDQLLLCGLAPSKKRRAPTVEERALAAARSRVTRAAKGIQGSKRRRSQDVQEGLAAAYGPTVSSVSVTQLSI